MDIVKDDRGIMIIGAGIGDSLSHRLMAGLRQLEELEGIKPMVIITTDSYRTEHYREYPFTRSTDWISIDNGYIEHISSFGIEPENKQKNPRMSQFIRDRIDAQNRKADRKKHKKR